MMIQYRIRGYDQLIDIRDSRIFKFSCTCWNFENDKCSKKHKTIEPCKHLVQAISMIDKELIKNEHT